MKWTGAVAGAAAITSMLATGLAPAQAATASGWKVAATIGKTTQFVTERGLAATGSHDAWSLWSTCTAGAQCDSGKHEMVLAHWNGSTWTARRPAALQKIWNLTAFGASSASNVWAFGGQPERTDQPDKATPAWQWNGRTWVRHTLPSWVIRKDGEGTQDAVAEVFGPKDLWVFTVNGTRTTNLRLAGHYNGSRWVKYYLPAEPVEVSALSRNNIWAVGYTVAAPHQLELMHWNGKNWSGRAFPTLQSPAGSLDYFADLTVTGRSVSMLGTFGPTFDSHVTYLLSWIGSAWQKILVPAKTVSGLAPDGHGGWWTISIAGSGRDSFLHRSHGRWTSSRVPGLSWAPIQEQMGHLTLVPGTATVLAAGDLSKLGDKGDVGALWQRRG